MFPAPFRVVLDANVLYPFTLRDTLLRAAAEGLYQVYWSAQILDEAQRNLVANGVMTDEKAARLRAVMEGAFPEAMVTDHEPLIGAMKNDEKDRHVVAAAMKAGAQVIVTGDSTGFRSLPEGVEAQSPDVFLSNLLDLDARLMVELVEEQAAALRKPLRSVEQLLAALAKFAPGFAADVRVAMAGGSGEEDGDPAQPDIGRRPTPPPRLLSGERAHARGGGSLNGKLVVRVSRDECLLSVSTSAGPLSEGFAQERTIAVGGDALDSAIIKHVERRHRLLIGERTPS